MRKLESRREVNALVLLFSLTYMISYITRINYGTIISAMGEATQMPKNLLSMSLTGSFVTYGAGQIISGICGDRFSPKKLVSYGLIVSIVMNFLIPLCQNPYQMFAVWCVNGFAQAFMWPPIVRLMVASLSDDDYKKATVKVSWGSSFGTIILYLLSPLLISIAGWKSVFVFSAVCGLIMVFVWNKFCCDIDAEYEKTAVSAVENSRGDGLRALFSPVVICIMLAIVLQGMLRDGVTTWMPSYISETYNMSSKIGILTGVVLPVFSIVCFRLAQKLYTSVFKNPLMCAGVIFGVGAAAALILSAFSAENAVLSVLLSAVLTGCMHGVNLILICMVPPFFKKYGSTSTVSGALNSCTYIGSASSTYGIAILSEAYDWHTTLFVWFLIALAGTALCLLNVRPWAKKWQSGN